MAAATDRKGVELKIGDAVYIPGKVVHVHDAEHIVVETDEPAGKASVQKAKKPITAADPTGSAEHVETPVHTAVKLLSRQVEKAK
jgi:hypothetical protein